MKQYEGKELDRIAELYGVSRSRIPGGSDADVRHACMLALDTPNKGTARGVELAAYAAFPMARDVSVSESWCAATIAIAAPVWWRAWWRLPWGRRGLVKRSRVVLDDVPAMVAVSVLVVRP